MEIKGKSAVVTGAGSGIGSATARRLAQEGAAVAVIDLDEHGGAETVRLIESAGGRAIFVRADVTNADDCRRMLEAAAAKFGRLDILHNNAGIASGAPPYPASPPEKWRRVVEIDLLAVVLGCGLAAPIMEKTGGGAIVNTASMAGLYPHPLDPVYGAAKAGVVNLTHSLAPWAQEKKVRVNCVCPGVVDTPMVSRLLAEEAKQGIASFASWKPAKMLAPEAIADAVVEIVRDDSLAGCSIEVRPSGRKIVEPRPMPGSRR